MHKFKQDRYLVVETTRGWIHGYFGRRQFAAGMARHYRGLFKQIGEPCCLLVVKAQESHQEPHKHRGPQRSLPDATWLPGNLYHLVMEHKLRREMEKTAGNCAE